MIRQTLDSTMSQYFDTNFTCNAHTYVTGTARSSMAFPIACTWQPITLLVIKVLARNLEKVHL